MVSALLVSIVPTNLNGSTIELGQVENHEWAMVKYYAS